MAVIMASGQQPVDQDTRTLMGWGYPAAASQAALRDADGNRVQALTALYARLTDQQLHVTGV